jgi:PAS domain S-box-containing protein
MLHSGGTRMKDPLLPSSRIMPEANLQSLSIPFDTRSQDETTFFFDNDLLFQSAFTHAAIGVALVGLNGHWLRVNGALCQIVGYPEAELLHTTFQALTHPDDLNANLHNLQSLFAGAIPSYQMEKRYFHKSGRVVWILPSVSLVRSRHDQPLFYIAQIQNIDDRKRMEAELKARNAELTEALAHVQELEGIVPICMYCKSIRDDTNYWHRLEAFISEHSKARFSHCVCPECMERFKKEVLPQVPEERP